MNGLHTPYQSEAAYCSRFGTQSNNRYAAAMTGYEPRGVSCTRTTYNSAGACFSCQNAGRMADRIGQSCTRNHFAIDQGTTFHKSPLSLYGNCGKRPNRLHWIVTRGAFFGKHDRIRAIQHGICYVRSFGASRARTVNHGTQHLRRRDHRPTSLNGFGDCILLYQRNILIGYFYPKVAAGHHHAVGGGNPQVHVARSAASAVAYFESQVAATVDPRWFGGAAEVVWYDPASGRRVGSQRLAGDRQSIKPPISGDSVMTMRGIGDRGP